MEWDYPTVWVENWVDAACLLLSIVGYEWHWFCFWLWEVAAFVLDKLTDCNCNSRWAVCECVGDILTV